MSLPDHSVELIRHTFLLTLLVVTPILLVGLIVGLVVSSLFPGGYAASGTDSQLYSQKLLP